jgi:phosphoglycerol transferase MdoB-like AlkP superfamily enzyme
MQRIKEYLKGNIYLVLLFRLLLLYVVYTVCRVLFYTYNHSHFSNISNQEFLKIFAGGLLFDTSSIVYINIIYLFLYLLPFKFRHNKNYQGVLMVLFFLTNGLALFANIADIVYYEFVLQRTTMDIFDQFKNEENMGGLTITFLINYWYFILLWLGLLFFIGYFYVRIKIATPRIKSGLVYFFSGLFVFVISCILIIGGARGGFKQFAQPITMNSAWLYVKKPEYAAIVLNTPFTLIHSVEKRSFERVKYYSSKRELDSIYTPYHKAENHSASKENVDIFVVESLNKEFVGSLNKDLEGGTYKGFTPFLDSLITVSKVFRHSYANGRKSIDILPSLFCSLPRIGLPFVLMTPYYRNKLNSLPALLKEIGYKSAFFHGAPNGSFGFQSFTNIIGVDDYYGMDEYNHDADYDGSWGIWDEEFMQYFATNIDTFSTPFIATLFSVTSHHPFFIPVKYNDRFIKTDFPPERCMQYTDYSLRRFFETASKMPWFKNTLFIITADHVSVNQRPEFQNEIGYFSVPIIFFKPGSNFIGMDTITNAQQIDIMPTLLNYLGYNKEYFSFGKDLFGNKEKNFAFNYLNNTFRLFTDDKLLIFNGKEINGFYKVNNRILFEINTDSSKLEKKNMETFLKAYIQQYVNRMIDNRLTEK